MTEKLKPCPFCGGEAFMADRGIWHFDDDEVRKYQVTSHEIRCLSCGVQSGSFATEQEAIKAWNRRVGE